MSKLIYIDMDDVLADFQSAATFNPRIKTEPQIHKMYEPGFFRNLKPVAGSQQAVRQLINMGHDIQILTQPLAESATSYQEKVEWIAMYFPELIKKINMSQNKGNFVGDYLIDDNLVKWKDKFEANGGKFIHFEYKRLNDESNRKMWSDITDAFAAWKTFEEMDKKDE